MKANISVSYKLYALSAATFFVIAVDMAHAEGMQRGIARVADCVKQTSAGKPDQCVVRPSTGEQSCFVNVNTLTGDFSMASTTFRSLPEAGGQSDFPGKLKVRPYQFNSRSELWETEALSRNATAKVQISVESGAPVKTDIFLRHDPEGVRYTRVRCSALTPL